MPCKLKRTREYVCSSAGDLLRPGCSRRAGAVRCHAQAVYNAAVMRSVATAKAAEARSAARVPANGVTDSTSAMLWRQRARHKCPPRLPRRGAEVCRDVSAYCRHIHAFERAVG